MIGKQKYEEDLISMKKDNAIVVCIPYYKKYENFSEFERSLLLNNIRIFQNYTIVFLTPYWLIVDVVNIINKLRDGEENPDLRITPVGNKRLRSVITYDQFLKSLKFYDLFNGYDYVCICQLDAWVFSDNLVESAAGGYPILAAPWLSDEKDGEQIFLGVGNGGYSLRKVKLVRKVLSRRFMRVDSKVFRLWINKILLPDTRGVVGKLVEKRFKVLILRLIANCEFLHYALIASILLQEDLYLSLLMYSSIYRDKMPSLYEATSFSVEKYPRQLINKF